MQNDVIQNKLVRIEEYLTKLEEIRPDDFKEFEKDWKTRMIAERASSFDKELLCQNLLLRMMLKISQRPKRPDIR